MSRIFFLWCVLLLGSISVCGQPRNVRRVALLDIVDNEKLFSDGVKLLIRSRLSSAIANTPGYESYDRVDIASIMDEQQFQRTGLVDDSQIKRLGEMTGADYILVAEAAEFDDSHIVMIAKILNVESARLERISDVTTTTDIDMLEKSCRELIRKLLTVRQELKIGENLYVGESKGGIPDGEGLMRFSEDDPEGRKSYKGSWLNGKCHGKGTLAYTGGVYIGNFNAGTRSGFGIFSYPDGSRYEGNWVNDKMDGNGRFYYAKDDLDSRHFLNGYWKNGIITGEGRLFYKNGNYKVGIFVNGRMDGEWKCYDLYGTHIANQIFKNGIPVKTKRLNKK